MLRSSKSIDGRKVLMKVSSDANFGDQVYLIFFIVTSKVAQCTVVQRVAHITIYVTVCNVCKSGFNVPQYAIRVARSST